jgi:hypothetical protein
MMKCAHNCIDFLNLVMGSAAGFLLAIAVIAWLVGRI